MSNQFKSGDRVQWSSGSGVATGQVQKKITERTEVDGQTVDASTDDPRYLVENDSTGNVTGHRPETLQTASETSTSVSQNAAAKSGQDGSDQILKDFKDVVNMTAKEIKDWLETDASNSVGQDAGDGEAKGHKSGRHIVDILGKKRADYNDGDWAHMKKVIAYVHRHTAQKPSGNVKETDWRYSLMNWGHDPLK